VAVTALKAEPLPVVRAVDLARRSPQQRWLVRDFWAQQAQGIIGGAPKLGKSWLGLDLAVSVASGTACLGRFEVVEPGRALIYLAEDAEPAVRERIEAICEHRGVGLATLDLHVITAPAIRLDCEEDQQRLECTLQQLRPRLLVLDPLVRLHRLDENSAQDISRLLGMLTELSRRYELAIALVHHAAKKHRTRPGQALRGSSDLHAWGASNAYLAQTRDGLLLTLEHREALALEPLRLELVSNKDGAQTHLEVVDHQAKAEATLTQRVIDELRQATKPLLRQELRQRLRVNNARLGDALRSLDQGGSIQRGTCGWCLPASA